MPTPLVSFILPSHNRKPVLRQVLGRLQALSQTITGEIIVVDNASEDGSADMVANEFTAVRLIALDRNLGAVSRNIGLTTARGRYVVMLDDDSFPCPGTVETALRVFENDRDHQIGCIAFNIRQADGSYETAGIYTHFTGCGAMFRKSVFDLIGGYPQDYLFYAEEYDLSCRIWDQGMRVLNFRQLEAVHLKTPVNRDFGKIIRQLVRNNMMLWSKYLPQNLARRQIDTELWRYEKIALKENVAAGYDEGKEQGAVLAGRYGPCPDTKVSDAALDKIVDRGNIHRRIEALATDLPGAHVLIFNLGKLAHTLIAALRDNGLHIEGIVDDNPFMQGNQFDDVPIFDRRRFNDNHYDAVVIGSSSLSLNDTFQAQLEQAKRNVPVTRLCDYDPLQQWLA